MRFDFGLFRSSLFWIEVICIDAQLEISATYGSIEI